ncbi:MAG: DUF4340 domain-containing protein [Gemmatimonadales bacterium]
MSSQQLLRLAAVLAAVLVLWGVVALASRGSEGSTERGSILVRIDTATIDTIALTEPGDTTTLTRDGTAAWRVNGHRAEAQAVSELLEALVDTGASVELIARNPSSHSRLRVTEDSGRRIRVVDGGRIALDLIAGKQTSDWAGVYLRRANQPEVYVVRGDLPSALTRSGDEWRDRTIATVSPDSIGTIEIRRGSRSYKLLRKGSSWVFTSGASADSVAVANLISSYKNLEVDGFANAAQEDSLSFARPRRTARLLDRRGTPLLSLAFDSIASGIWVRLADARIGRPANGQAYRLETWTADRLTPAESTLRKQ